MFGIFFEMSLVERFSFVIIYFEFIRLNDSYKLQLLPQLLTVELPY